MKLFQAKMKPGAIKAANQLKKRSKKIKAKAKLQELYKSKSAIRREREKERNKARRRLKNTMPSEKMRKRNARIKGMKGVSMILNCQ